MKAIQNPEGMTSDCERDSHWILGQFAKVLTFVSLCQDKENEGKSGEKAKEPMTKKHIRKIHNQHVSPMPKPKRIEM